jgi:SAM-dependent methyltransferase
MINPTRAHVDAFAARAARSVAEGQAILDAGAGICQYRPLFAHARYKAADFAQVEKPYGELDIVYDLKLIPVDDASFDAVLFTQTLEHLPDPGDVLRELARVLKPGGSLLATAPFVYQEHEQPFDFYRYTRFGLKHLLEQAGFVIEELSPLGGYFGAAAYQLDYAARHLPRRPAAYAGGIHGVAAATIATVARPCLAVFARLLAGSDLRTQMDADVVKSFAVVARKPGSPPEREELSQADFFDRKTRN